MTAGAAPPPNIPLLAPGTAVGIPKLNPAFAATGVELVPKAALAPKVEVPPNPVPPLPKAGVEATDVPKEKGDGAAEVAGAVPKDPVDGAELENEKGAAVIEGVAEAKGDAAGITEAPKLNPLVVVEGAVPNKEVEVGKGIGGVGNAVDVDPNENGL